jgi:biotin carboxylase
MVAEVYPSGLNASDEERVIEEARRGAAALGHTRGPCYSQVALARERCVLFETAARMGGGFDADVTRLASGVDLYDRILGVAVGDSALEHQGATTARHGGAIAKFLIGKPGRLNAVRGLDRARAIEGIDDAQVFVPVGACVMPLTDSAKRAGYALAHGATREQAMTRADEALAQLSLDTSDIPP